MMITTLVFTFIHYRACISKEINILNCYCEYFRLYCMYV